MFTAYLIVTVLAAAANMAVVFLLLAVWALVLRLAS
jgi:hypothetical protein